MAFLYRNYMLYKSIGVCSIQMVVDYLRYDTQNNHQIVAIIKDAITGLLGKGYITEIYDLHYEPISIEDISKNRVFYVELVPPPEECYFVVDDKDLNKILEYLKNQRISKFNLIRYFIACRRVSNNNSKVGFLAQSKLKELLNDSKTISKYNKILQDDLCLIKYNSNYMTSDKHYCSTFIGRYEDAEKFDDYVKEQVKERNLIPTNKVTSNQKRKLQQKINHASKKYAENEKDARIAELESLLKQKEALEYKLPAATPSVEVTSSEEKPMEDTKTKPEASTVEQIHIVKNNKYINEALESLNHFDVNVHEGFFVKNADVVIREMLKTDEKGYRNDHTDENGFYDLDKLIAKDKAI